MNAYHAQRGGISYDQRWNNTAATDRIRYTFLIFARRMMISREPQRVGGLALLWDAEELAKHRVKDSDNLVVSDEYQEEEHRSTRERISRAAWRYILRSALE